MSLMSERSFKARLEEDAYKMPQAQIVVPQLLLLSYVNIRFSGEQAATAQCRFARPSLYDTFYAAPLRFRGEKSFKKTFHFTMFA